MTPRRWLLLVLAGVSLVTGMRACPLVAQQEVVMPAADRALRREARERFAVGAAEGTGEDVFGSVGDVAFDGAEYVLDRLNARVVVFDSTGRFVRALGRRGGGPGEFSAPQRMAVTRDGEVIVSDAGRRALAVFSPDGRGRSVPFPGTTLLLGRTLALHPRGGIVSLAMGNPAAGGANAFGEELLMWMPLGAGTPRRIAGVSTPRSRTSGGEGVRVRAPLIFSPAFHFAVLPSGDVAIVDDATYTVRIVDSNGGTLRVLRRPLEPRPVTARDRERERERRAAQQSGAGGLRVVGARGAPLPPSVGRAMAAPPADADFARVMPVIRRMAADPAGNLWIERTGPSLDRPGGIDVVTPAGRYLGTLAGWELPAAFSPRGRVAYVREDAFGVQRVVVVRVRLEPPSP